MFFSLFAALTLWGPSLYLSCSLSFSLAHLLTLFPSLKDWRGWFITVPCQKPFPQHDENNVPVIGIERHRLRDRSRSLLFSAPLKIGLHPWDHFKGFCTLTKSSCERWTTQTTVPCYAWTCSTTETIVLTIRLAFTMSTSPDRLVHIFLFSLLLLVPLRHPLLVLLFLSFFFFLSLISFFPLSPYFASVSFVHKAVHVRTEQISSQIWFNSWSQAAIMLSILLCIHTDAQNMILFNII